MDRRARTARRRAGWVRGALVVALLLAGTPRPARADEAADQAAAHAAFEEGLRAFEAGDFAVACPKLRGAVVLTKRRALGGLLLLARCFEAQGRVASAWATFREVAAKAAAEGRHDRVAEAERGAERVAPRLAKVRIELLDATPLPAGATVEHETSPIPPSLWGTDLPVDPGRVTFVLRADGYETQRRVLDVGEGATVTLQFDPLVPVPPAPQPLEPRPAEPRSEEPRSEEPRVVDPVTVPASSASGTPGLVVVGWTLTGLGGAGLLAGGVLAGVAKASYDRAYEEQRCGRSEGRVLCDDPQDLAAARRLGDAATATLVVSGLVAASGVVVLIVAPRVGDDLQLGIGPASVVVKGAF